MRNRSCIVILLVSTIIYLGQCRSASNYAEINNKILETKGFNDSKRKRLKPMILHMSEPVYCLQALSKKNCLATLDRNGRFAYLVIDENGTAAIKTIGKGFPEKGGMVFHSDDEHNVLWMIQGGRVSFLDLTTKKTGQCIPNANAGLDSIGVVFLADPEKKIFLIEVQGFFCLTDIENRKQKDFLHYVLYDLNQDKIVFTSPKYSAFIYPFINNTILFQGDKYNDKLNSSKRDWQLKDLFGNPLKSNNLIEGLNKHQVSHSHHSKEFHLGKRMALGHNWGPRDSSGNRELMYWSVRWDEKLEDVDIAPLYTQMPDKDYILNIGDCTFSWDGSWVKSEGHRKNLPFICDMRCELVFYHVDSKYPQGLSLPLYCGFTRCDGIGAFLNHDTWGPCYVEVQSDFSDLQGTYDDFSKVLFVYKLNEGLEILERQTTDMLK